MAFSWAESVAVQTGSPVVWCDSRTSAALRWPFDDVDMAKRWQLLSATQLVRAWALWVYSACGRGRHTQQKSRAQDIILAPTPSVAWTKWGLSWWDSVPSLHLRCIPNSCLEIEAPVLQLRAGGSFSINPPYIFRGAFAVHPPPPFKVQGDGCQVRPSPPPPGTDTVTVDEY